MVRCDAFRVRYTPLNQVRHGTVSIVYFYRFDLVLSVGERAWVVLCLSNFVWFVRSVRFISQKTGMERNGTEGRERNTEDKKRKRSV